MPKELKPDAEVTWLAKSLAALFGIVVIVLLIVWASKSCSDALEHAAHSSETPGPTLDDWIKVATVSAPAGGFSRWVQVPNNAGEVSWLNTSPDPKIFYECKWADGRTIRRQKGDFYPQWVATDMFAEMRIDNQRNDEPDTETFMARRFGKALHGEPVTQVEPKPTTNQTTVPAPRVVIDMRPIPPQQSYQPPRTQGSESTGREGNGDEEFDGVSLKSDAPRFCFQTDSGQTLCGDWDMRTHFKMPEYNYPVYMVHIKGGYHVHVVMHDGFTRSVVVQ